MGAFDEEDIMLVLILVSHQCFLSIYPFWPLNSTFGLNSGKLFLLNRLTAWKPCAFKTQRVQERLTTGTQIQSGQCSGNVRLGVYATMLAFQVISY